MIYNINNFDYSLIAKSKNQRRKKGNQGRRNNKRVYKDLICAFDIETTNDRESVQAFMYVWQFQIDNITIMGRTWNEFITMLQRMAAHLNRDQYIVIFVHNLSFELNMLLLLSIFCVSSYEFNLRLSACNKISLKSFITGSLINLFNS